jgi:hypothetical protein|tara:strand:+ start:385 stop:492 length:108 start_codon:yes stop_codon:yes gene_type:complete
MMGLQDKDLVEDKLDCEGIFKQSSLTKVPHTLSSQ